MIGLDTSKLELAITDMVGDTELMALAECKVMEGAPEAGTPYANTDVEVLLHAARRLRQAAKVVESAFYYRKDQ